MEQKRLCSDCFILVRGQLINRHGNLVERNHIHNDTVYVCNSCHNLICLSHVPHEWSVIGVAEKFDDQPAQSA
ncbi:hypothetical protein [Amphritea sp.]|uniref:hypothetical protein n=1 Tax=Amphritea sp. TaxID=1872502 RepID=UPI0025B88190|nr:hypothetical protein [Amphritea sp.]